MSQAITIAKEESSATLTITTLRVLHIAIITLYKTEKNTSTYAVEVVEFLHMILKLSYVYKIILNIPVSTLFQLSSFIKLDSLIYGWIEEIIMSTRDRWKEFKVNIITTTIFLCPVNQAATLLSAN